MKPRFTHLVTPLFSTLFTAAMAAAALGTAPPARADITIVMNAIDAAGVQQSVGQVLVTQTPYGLVFAPTMDGLPAGLHGFHVHENPSCAALEKGGQWVPAGAAGGHYDPHHAGRHSLPWGEGHLGDLPALYVDASGHAAQPMLAPRLSLADLAGRSLMVHTGGDNHADHPAALGGGGARLICGVAR